MNDKKTLCHNLSGFYQLLRPQTIKSIFDSCEFKSFKIKLSLEECKSWHMIQSLVSINNVKTALSLPL